MKTPPVVALRFGVTLAIAALQNSLMGAITFSRIIGPGDPMPDTAETVAFIRDFMLDEASAGDRALVGLTGGPLVALYFVDSAKNFQRVISTETAKPGGGTFGSIQSATAYDGKVYFVAESGQLLCRVDQPGGPVTLIASKDDLNAGTNRFVNFANVSADASGVVFDAGIAWLDGSLTYMDIFHRGSGAPVSVIGYATTSVPGSPGAIFVLNQPGFPIVRDGEVAFLGTGFPLVEGSYAFPTPGATGTPRRIVDKTQTPPGSTLRFSALGPPDIDRGEAVFFGNTSRNVDRGLYRHNVAAGISAVVTTNTALPSGEDNFTGADSPSLSNGRTIFRGTAGAVSGIYLDDGVTLQKIVASGETIDGNEVFSFELTRDGFVGNQLVFLANSALYRATLEESTPPARVTLRIVPNGDLVEVSWDAAAAGPNAVLQSSGSLYPADWQPVASQTNPYQVQPESTASRYFRLRL